MPNVQNRSSIITISSRSDPPIKVHFAEASFPSALIKLIYDSCPICGGSSRTCLTLVANEIWYRPQSWGHSRSSPLRWLDSFPFYKPWLLLAGHQVFGTVQSALATVSQKDHPSAPLLAFLISRQIDDIQRPDVSSSLLSAYPMFGHLPT